MLSCQADDVTPHPPHPWMRERVVSMSLNGKKGANVRSLAHPNLSQCAVPHIRRAEQNHSQ